MEISFLLQAAGVGEDDAGAHLQALHFQVGHGVEQGEPLQGAGLAGLIQFGTGARVQGEHDGQILGDLTERGEDAVQSDGIIGVFLAVEGTEGVTLFRESIAVETDTFAGELAVVEDRVVHDITDVVDALLADTTGAGGGREGIAFLAEIVDGGCGRAEQQGGYAIGEDAVDFLGHVGVVRAQAGFDMGHGDVELGGGERPGEGRVGVAVDEYPVGLFLLDERFDAFEHAAGHGAMSEAGDAEVMIRAGDIELVEEDIRHVGIEMLAGVDDDLPDVVVGTNGPTDRGGFDELRPGAKDGEDFHAQMAVMMRVCWASVMSGLIGKLMTRCASRAATGVQSGQQRWA